jgi:hypothetical protein
MTAQKNAARDSLEKLVKELGARVSVSSMVSETHRQVMGIRSRPRGRVAAGPISTRPILSIDITQRLRHTLEIVDETTPDSRQRPIGVLGLELWIKKGSVVPAGISDCQFLEVVPKTTKTLEFPTTEAGTMVHYIARWVDRDGNKGPISGTVSAMIIG